MKVNINDEVVVRLTEHGERIWTDYWNRSMSMTGVPEAVQKQSRTADGRVRFQLHQLMYIFGSFCYNGSNTMPFERNEIDL